MLIGDGTGSLILLFIKLSWNPTPAKVISNHPWFSLRPDSTNLKFRGEQLISENRNTQLPKDNCARSNLDFLQLLPQRENLGSLKPAQHQSEVRTVRGLTLPVICSTGTSLLWWGDGDVCFGFELEYIFLSDAHKTLIRAWNNLKRNFESKPGLVVNYMLSWKRSHKHWSVYGNIGSKPHLPQKIMYNFSTRTQRLAPKGINCYPSS